VAELAALRDAYRGETVVFIGAGTSIRPYDLSRIRHRLVSCNYFLPFGPERWGVTLEAYLCHDPRVFFVPWERHRAGKNIVSPDGDLSRFPSPADYIVERELCRKTKLILPATLDWYTGFDTHWLFEGQDTHRHTQWLPSLLASGAGDHVFTYRVTELPRAWSRVHGALTACAAVCAGGCCTVAPTRDAASTHGVTRTRSRAGSTRCCRRYGRRRCRGTRRAT
jgi:hypothetical protein